MTVKEYKFQIDGHELLLRNPSKDDAQALIDYLKTVSEETRFMIREPEEVTMTLQEEMSFICRQNQSETALMLLGFLDGEHAGSCSFMGSTMSRYRHRASLAIALYQKFTGMGIGKKMIQTLCEIAAEHGIEQMELEVVADNERAVALYKKMGFAICGTLPHNMKYKDGTYADTYVMVKMLNDECF